MEAITKSVKMNFWNGKNVAITGAGGFLGGHFVSKLMDLGAIVKVLSREELDLTNSIEVTKVLRNIEVVINCAALDGNSEFKKNHPAEILDTNMRIASNILAAARDNNISDVVLISSSEIYSSYAPNPIKEEDDYRLYGGHTSNGYILSKRFGEILADLYREQYSLRVYFPRLSNIFGPGDHFGDLSTRVIPSFIDKILKGDTIEIWGDGSQTRQFIYVEDAVVAIMAMVENQSVGALNISTSETITILNLAKKVSSLLGVKAKLKLDISKSTGSQDRVLDISKMTNLVGSSSLMSLDDGLSKTLEWYKEKINK